MRKQNKYNVSPKEERTYLGRTFGSKAERRYCEQLEMMWEAGVIFDYICQPAVWLGVPENKYKPDFLVVPHGGVAYYVEVKGMETTAWKRNKKLWQEYGRLKLVVVRETSPGKFKTMEELPA